LLLGTTGEEVSRYENGKIEPNDQTKVIMAKRLNVSLDYRLGIINEPIPYYDSKKTLLLPRELNESLLRFLSYNDTDEINLNILQDFA
jgi:transcriptional regulator with XRE-family HTH domain